MSFAVILPFLRPIEHLILDEGISEVMVNGPKKVYVEKSGKLIKTPITFDDDDHVLRIIDRIVLPLGRRVDPDSVARIAADARRLLPGLLPAEPSEAWVGFRPATPQQEPYIRRWADTNLWLAYGHFRNGILLAPATAQRIANVL